MAYNPEEATPLQKWNFRMEQLNDYLKEIPFTSTQRLMIEHHLRELSDVFHNLRIAAEDAGVIKSVAQR